MVDFMQDNWKVKVDYPINGEWIGKTFFRVYGPYESDYNIESVEIREAITDYEFVGREKEGECMISMFSPRSIKGVFVEDNQATIRILENGKSPTFRHTDKTQRVNLSWLEEQFKRRWYKLVHGPSMLQAADILTKPFVNAEKWKLAVKLLALTPTKKITPPKALASASEAITPPIIATPSTGGPAAKSDTKRLIVEVCCHPESKLSQTNRKWSEGCEVLQFTEEFDLNEVENQMRIAEYVNSFKGDVKPFIWISLPCTGGTPWTYINMKNPSAREKVLKHVREFDRLWISLKSFLRMLNCEVHIALEWPRKCRYWKLTKVAKLLNFYGMIAYHFDGCALGMVNQDNDPLKKPWTVATNHAGVGKALSKFQCTCNRRHAPGRGIALKKTEEYTFRMTDAIHKALTRQHPALKLTCCALIAPFCSPVFVMLTRAIQMAKACAVAGRPAILERITQWEGVVNTLKAAIAVATWDDPQVLLREMEGCRLPLANIVEPMLGGGNAEGAYDTLAEVYKNTPDGFLAMCPYPPGGEVDLLIVSDSSLALVPDPNAGKASCFSGGDLLKPWGDIRGIYTKMLWGKGLNHMVQYIPEAIDDIESTNRAHGRPVLPVLVIVGWAGNDVYGEGGYRGVHWIHRAAYNKSAADREVTANWCERQKARVERSVNELGQLKRDEPRILDIVVVGNADADIFALPSAYNETMRVHIRALREDHGIQTLDTTLMLARTVRYDKVHLEDDVINRKYVTNFLQAVADCHLAYLKLISVDDHLRTLPRIDDLQEQKNYPNLTILKAAYQLEIDSNVSSPKDLPQRPDPEKLMLDADVEIFNWVLQAEESATASADREVESWLRDIPEEDQALEPMHHDNADSDDEAVKVQALTMDDRILARRKGLSEEHDQEWQDATYAAEDEDEDFKGWDLIEDDKRPPGVVASDPVHEEEKELDLDDLETVASVEIVDEEEFHDAEEGQAEPIDDDDDDDMAVIDKVSSMQASKSDARGDPEPMDVDDQGNKMVQSTASAKTWKTEMAQSSSSAKTWKTEMAQSTSSAKTWRTDTTAAASAGATPSDPTSKLKPKKKAMPKRLKVVDEGHGPSAEQFDTSKFASAQDLVWIEPDNMAGVPVRKVDYGRLGSISHAMSDYLRGHRLFHRRPSPEIRRTDLSMDFKALVRHLQGDFAHLREEEVLMVVRNSPMRRFRVQVNGLSSGKLRWTPVRIRAIQGHRAFLVEQGGMSSMIKTMFTFDENFDQTKIDDPSVHPAFSAMPEGSPVWHKFPRVVYHTCDQAAFNSIIKHGLIPGGFPYKTGRAHNFFNSTPPWKAEMKKLQGTRAGRPIAIAFDMELMMQMGYKLFATDEAILSPDWISNQPMINAFDMRSGEFFYINRAYVNHRKAYQEVLKEAKAEFDPTDVLMSRMEMLMENAQLNFEGIKERIEFGKLLPFSRREDIEVEKSTATREGEPASGSQLVSGYTVGKMAAMTSTDACGFQRRGRNGPGGGNWNRGQGRHGFELQFKDISYNQIQDTPQVRCSHPICGYLMMDGHLKCPRCFRQMEPVTDANIATEVARREAMARTRGVPFSMDKVIFNHPRRGRVARQPEKGSSSSSTAVRTRSTYGNLRDMAKNYVRSFKKRGFKDLVDRLVRDPFFQFNAANQNLVPEALLFIERLAGCVSPTIERTKAQVLGEKLEMATKLIFVPSSEREPDQPLDLHTEVFVSHRGVFLDIGQFAVYVAKFIKPRQRPLPIVYGWGNRDFVPDASDAKEIAKELVEFSKLQWSNFASQQTHKESETTGDDREVSLPHASAAISRPEHERPHHEQFEPNLGKPARGGPYGQGGGGKGHHKGGGQTKGKGQQKGKGKQGRSPPGGVAYGDFEGDSYWVQGYRYTWYWNQQRGWYWRWT